MQCFQVAWKRHSVFYDTKSPTPSPNPRPQYSPIWQCFWPSSTATTHPNLLQLPGTQNLRLIFFAWIYGFIVDIIFHLNNKISHLFQLFWANSLLALDVLFRWDLRLQDPRAECPLRGSGPGQVHWRGGHPGQGQAGLRAAKGAHVHHPSIRLWRGSRWRQHEEIPQVSQALLVQNALYLILTQIFPHSWPGSL